jgi:hypothetical protein
MGFIKHNAIIVTGEKGDVFKANKKACKIFKKYLKNNTLVSEVIPGVANNQYSFLIAPDGSKEGWENSNNADIAREKLCRWLHKKGVCEYIEIRFGGDDDGQTFVTSS